MTEKRFTTRNGVFYTDNKTGWEFQSYGEVVKLMNELADENEQLKQRNEFLKKQLDRVCDENEIMGDKLKQIGRML